MAHPAGPFALLAQLASGTAQQDSARGQTEILEALLDDLAWRCRVRYAALWVPSDSDRSQWIETAVARSFHGGASLPGVIDDPERLLTTAGVVATTDVTFGGGRRGMVVLANLVPCRSRSLPVGRIGDSVACVALVLSRGSHRVEADAAGRRAMTAVSRAAADRRELAAVQAVERDRLAVAVTANANSQLRTILAEAEYLGDRLRVGSADAAVVATAMRTRLHEMIEQFRTVVRGVYPQVLRASGVRAAIEEVTVSLGIPVLIEGDLGRRQGWEIESALFQAAASAISALGDPPVGEPIRIELRRSGEVLSIRLSRAGLEAMAVRVAMREDARRMAALGGQLAVEVGADNESVVDIRLSERLSDPGGEPAEPAPAPAPARHLLDMMVAHRETRQSVALRVALDRQDKLARVLLVGVPAARLLAAMCGRPVGGDELSPESGASVRYQYGGSPRIAVYPRESASGPVVFPAGSPLAWLDSDSEAVVDVPVEGLRHLRIRYSAEHASEDLAMRIRQWHGTPDGPPDAVVLLPAGPLAEAEIAFLNSLRAAAEPGFRPIVIGAAHDHLPAEVHEQLDNLCDATAIWRDGTGGGAAVERLLRARTGNCAPVLAVRWALRAGLACESEGQLDAELSEALEIVVAGSHEVAELDLLQALQTRQVVLPRAQGDAERLLGAAGRGSHIRLGLPDDAGPEDIARAAAAALVFWRTQAFAPGTDPRRSAYAQLVRTCEWLLTHRAGA